MIQHRNWNAQDPPQIQFDFVSLVIEGLIYFLEIQEELIVIHDIVGNLFFLMGRIDENKLPFLFVFVNMSFLSYLKLGVNLRVSYMISKFPSTSPTLVLNRIGTETLMFRSFKRSMLWYQAMLVCLRSGDSIAASIYKIINIFEVLPT